MANTPQDDFFYNPNSLRKWFAISSIVMMVFTIWMLLDDFGRDWKAYQQDFFVLRQKKYDQAIEQARKEVDQNKITEQEASLKAAETAIAAKEKDIERLREEIVKLKTREKLAVTKYQGEKAVWDVEKYEYEAHYSHKVIEGKPLDEKAHKAKEKLDKHWVEVLKLRDEANLATQAKEEKERELAAIFAEKVKTEKELKVTRATLDQLLQAKESTELTVSKLMRSAPIVDMANPTFRLAQVVLPQIRDDIYFSRVQKVDRCTTCHMAIDLPGYENEKQPFRTHPRLDVMLGSRSPHPLESIGCTVCHEGRGQATHFSRTAHTPRNHEQELEWKKKYGWASQHHVIEKMLPLQYTEGKCRVCHKQTEYVPRAQKLNTSYQLIKAAGCYGCHRIEGWDHLRKPAPSLKRVKGKLTRDWIVKWVRNPQSFNDHARMPAAFHQSNITSDEFKAYNEAEIHAITDYLLAISDEYRPTGKGVVGNAERGKALVGSVGCLGCHQINDFGQTRGRFTMAPDLSTVGSKVSVDWLGTWLKNPRHYWEETTMPSFRLTDAEVADITAYLVSKKNPEFEQAAAGTADVEVQKKVLKLYLMRDPKLAPVTEAKVDKVIAELQPHEIAQRLGHNAVQRYGCFGCHDLKGFEKTQGIGVELSDWGSKPVNKLDFGLFHGHANYEWAEKKLTDTRVYDKGIVKEYLDLLRMPQFGFSERERELIITALLGFTSQKVDPPAAKVLASWETKAENSSRLIHKYNCQGCHVMEGLFQPLPDDHPAKEEHDKMMYELEGRILVHYAEDETLGPPKILNEGMRVKPPWAHSFVHNPGQVKLRERLKVRMPTFQFTNDEVNTLVSGWAEEGKVEFPYPSGEVVRLTAQEQKDAQTLFTKLQCLNCHTIGRVPTIAEMEGGTKGLAPDLIHSPRRLNRKWIVELLRDPQKMIPGTRMPGFWPDGTSPAPEILNGDAEKQMDLLARYLLSLGQARAQQASTPAATPAPRSSNSGGATRSR